MTIITQIALSEIVTFGVAIISFLIWYECTKTTKPDGWDLNNWKAESKLVTYILAFIGLTMYLIPVSLIMIAFDFIW